jgi:NAD+ synthase (glutamine-hydrolysing)
MKIALAQINPIVGDLSYNIKKIMDFTRKAAKLNAEISLFPEMAITGYPPHDLLERPTFAKQTQNAMDELAGANLPIPIVTGAILPNPQKKGKPLQNCAVLIENNKIKHIQPKTLLPTYDVFDEHRYFSPADSIIPVPFKNMTLGLTVCEDIWKTPTGTLYEKDPVEMLVNLNADIIFNLSASPFTMDKRHFRKKLLKNLAKKHKIPIIFVNQVGGNDDLVFDGHSLAVDLNGKILAEGYEFKEDLITVDIKNKTGTMRVLKTDDTEAIYNALVLGTKDYALKCGFKSVVLGLSGGIDSALVATIAANALGPSNVHCIAMPTRYSSKGSLDDAEALAVNLGVNYKVISIDNLFQNFLDTLSPLFKGRENDVTEENIQARIRGMTLMALSNKFGHLLLTTGNKSEMATGYCTLYGDMAGGLAVISDVPKTMVFEIAKQINSKKEIIPESIITKPPSAELRENQKDEDSLPPYPVLDGILKLHVDNCRDFDEIVSEGYDPAMVKEIIRLVKINEYKRRQAPVGLKVTSKAFGPGRRMPLAQKWHG